MNKSLFVYVMMIYIIEKNSGTFGKKFRLNKKEHFDKEMRG